MKQWSSCFTSANKQSLACKIFYTILPIAQKSADDLMHRKQKAQIPWNILFFWKAKQQQYASDEDRWRVDFILTPVLKDVLNTVH